MEAGFSIVGEGDMGPLLLAIPFVRYDDESVL